jgi:membrane protein
MRSVNARAVANAAEPQVSVLREAAADAQRVRLPQMAAALTFRTIFGLVPVLVVALVLLKYFTSGDQIQRLLRAFVDRMGLGNIVLGQDADPAFVGPLPPTRLDDWVTDFVSRVEQINFAAIGLVSVLMLIYGAVAMVVEVETAFNQVYRVPRGRSWSRRLTNYWTLLTLGPLGLFATLYAGQRVPYWLDSGSVYLIEQFPRLVSGVGGEATLETARAAIEGLAYLAQFGISAGLLLVVYQVVPNTKVKLWPALTGAVLAASLFEASKFGFAQYVRFTASESYARLYGSIGLLPLFLLWVYFTWIIVLFGLQVSYQLQHGRGRTRAQPMLEAGPSIVEPTAGVVAMTALARAFDAGATLDAPAIAKASGLGDGVVRLVTTRLAERGLVHRLESGPDVEPSYALARPPATIRVAELLEIGFELSSSDLGSSTAALCEKLRRAQIQAAGDETLASAAGLPASTGSSAGTIPLEPAKA